MPQQIDHLVSLATAIPTPAMILMSHEKSGLEKLCEATPNIVMPLALIRATQPPSMLFADCTEPYRNTPSIPKAKGDLLYLLSTWAYTRIGL